MDKYVIGLDNGGTMIKAALFDMKGQEIGVASRMTEINTPHSGYTERNMESVWEANTLCVREVIEKTGIKPEKIIGIAVAGHGKGLYAWGKDDKPAYPGIVSTDNRAWKYPEKWKKDGTFEKLYPRLCQQIIACQQVSILAWLKDHEREVYDNIQWVFSMKDYIRFRLTGEAFCEATDISGSGLMNVRDARFDKDLLEAFGIGEVYDKLAPIRYSSETCGKITKEVAQLTGLLEGTPVAGGMFDIDSSAIGMAITEPEHMCTITGTWTINEFISKTPILGTDIAMNSLYAIPGYYLVEECSATSAGNLEWFIGHCMENEEVPEGKNIYTHITDLVESVEVDNCDVYYLPFLYGTNAHPLAKGSFIGLTSYHGKAHMLRAIFEGVCFSAKTHIDKLLSVRERPEAIRLAGGVANSKVWVQMFADVLNLPIETVDNVKELGALGCGMAASIAGGVYKDYPEAAKEMVRINPPVYPNPEKAEIYKEKFAKYTAVSKALDTVWDQFEV